MNTGAKVLVGGIIVGSLTYLVLHAQRQKYLFSNSCFKMGGFTPTKISSTETNVKMKMYIRNKSDVGFWLKNQRYDLYLDDQYISTLEKPDRTYISANYLNEEWLDFTVNPKQAFGTLVQTLIDKLVGKSDMRVSIKYSLVIGSGIFSMTYRDEMNTTIEELVKTTTPPC